MKRLKDAPNRKRKILVLSQKVCSITPSRTQAVFGQGVNPSACILPVSAVVPCLSFFLCRPLFGGAPKLHLVCHQRTLEMLLQNVELYRGGFIGFSLQREVEHKQFLVLFKVVIPLHSAYKCRRL